MIKTALKFMRYDKPKSIGVIVGIIISVFLIGQQLSTLFFLTNLMGGIEIHSNSNEDDIWIVDELSKNINALNPIDERLVQEVKSIEGVLEASPVIIASAPATFKDGKTATVLLIGSQGPSFVAGPKSDVVFEGNRDELNSTGNISIEYFNERSWKTELSINETIEINKKAATVKVKTKYAQGYGGNYVYTNIDNARFYSNYPPFQINLVIVRPAKGVDIQQVIDTINGTFMGLSAWRSKDIRDITINEILVRTNTGVSFGSLVVFAIISGFFIIGLTLYSSALDRLQDYGTLKAIGATNSYVSRLILMQAVLFACIGFAIAYALLILFQKGLENVGMTLDFNGPFSLGLFIITLFMSVGGSLFAVFKIRKVEPASVF